MNTFNVYTDGGCTNNGKKNARCSIGIHFPKIYFPLEHFPNIKDISNLLKVNKSSNNVAELTAIYECLKILKENNIKSDINIYSDSQYSMNCITKWYPNWVKKGIVKTKKNHELLTEIYNLYKEFNKTSFIYIKAHTGLNDEHSMGNSVADELASNALKFELKSKTKTNDILNYYQ